MDLKAKNPTVPNNKRLIKSFLVIESSGLNVFSLLFHRSDLDDVLFAGFSAAIVAFAKEMGKELQSLTLDGETFYFKTKDGFIFILSTMSRFEEKKAFALLEEIITAVDWKQMESYLNKEVFFLTNDFEEKVKQIIEEAF